MRLMIQRVGLLLAMLAAILPAAAYDFEVDGIYYNITSMSDLEVGVTYREHTSDGKNVSYSGDVKIPATVNYNNKTFTVTSIGSRAFGAGKSGYGSNINGCYFTSVELPPTIVRIEGYAFYNCGFETKSIELPNSITYIGSCAFSNCYNLLHIGFPDNLRKIDKSAFSGTKAWSGTLYIPDSVVSIAYDAFSFCGLEQVVLGKGLESIGDAAFGYNSGLKEVFCKASTPPWKYHDPFMGAHSALVFFVPCFENYEGLGSQAVQYLSYSIEGADNENGRQSFEYSGQPHTIMWKNNLKAYTCEVSDCNTEVSVGTYTKQLSVKYSNGIDLTVDVPCSYEITPAPMTLTVDNAQRIYGEPNPPFTYSITGFVNGETEQSIGATPTLECEASQFSSAGRYRIGASMNVPNYEVKCEYGILTITKRNLVVKAVDCSRYYGAPNPDFKVSYIGFINDDTSAIISVDPKAECEATPESNVGTYPITVSGGFDDNYSFEYQNGLLEVKPREVGWKNVYNYVTYNDMSLSTRDDYFNYRPVIEGEYDDDVFKIELWYLDGDNRMTNHVTTITDGEYAGNYVSTDVERPMNVGKYIFNLVPTGTNPNYTANPSQAFVTVTPASNYLEWNASEPVKVKVGETVDLGISYQANIWCKFETDYDSELMTLTSKDVIGKEPHWYVTGVKEGETILTFGINCLKNDMGFYDFTDCEAISKKVIVEPISGIDSTAADSGNLFVTTQNGEVTVHNAPEKSIVRVFALTGSLITETTDKTIRNLSAGMYIVVVDGKSFKINIR